MSRDNVVYVGRCGQKWYAWEQSASVPAKCVYMGDAYYVTRASGLVAGHELAKDWDPEYGVVEIELDATGGAA